MTKEEISKLAYMGDKPDEPMNCAERCLWYAMRDIYRGFQAGSITKEQGDAEKRKAFKQYDLDIGDLLQAKAILARNANMWAEIETYRAGHERLCSESTMHIDCKGLQGEELQKAKSEIPMGKELTKIDMFSYQALRNICRQRANHRLPEWHEFIDWVHTLPLAEELIFVGL